MGNDCRGVTRAVHCARLTGCNAMDSVNQLLLGVGGAEPVTLAGDVPFKTDLLTELLHSLADVLRSSVPGMRPWPKMS
jgi:hypothetical protein